MEEKVYLETPELRVTNAYISLRGKRIIPLEKIRRSTIVKRSMTEKCAMCGTVLFAVLFVREGYSWISFGFVVLFVLWLAWIWRRFAELWCVVGEDAASAVRIAATSRWKIGRLYDAQDALDTAMEDFHSKPAHENEAEDLERRRRKIQEELGENFRED